MPRWRAALICFALGLCGLATAPAAAAAAEDEVANVIKYRQLVMKSLEAHMDATAAVVSGDVNYWHHVGEHAVAISGLSRGMLELFPHWTGPNKGDTRALPAVWKRWPDFEAAAVRFNAEAARLVVSIGSIDRRAIGAQLAQVEKACTACHDTFLKSED